MQSPVLAAIEMSVSPSVCRLSHAGTVHCVKMTQDIKKSSTMDSPRTLVLTIYIIYGSFNKSERVHPRARSLNESLLGKIGKFRPLNRCISETVQARTKVTVNH